jgi:hypothetical protein
MDSIALQIGLLLAVLFLVERLANARGWTGVSVAGVPVLTWVTLTAMAVWVEGVVAFVALHLLLFALGTGAAWAGLVVTAVVLVGTPIATAVLLRRGAGQPTVRS